MNDTLAIILGLTGGGGAFGIMRWLLPELLKYMRERRLNGANLQTQAMASSGSSLNSSQVIIKMLEKRLENLSAEHEEDIEILKTRYERRIDMLKQEIISLKSDISWYQEHQARPPTSE